MVVNAFNLLGIGLLLFIVVGMLVWQNHIWQQVKPYESPYPLDYIEFDIHVELNKREIALLCAFESNLFDALGLDFGGGMYSFVSYGCTVKQAKDIEAILDTFFKAMNKSAVIESWQHLDVPKDEEGEENNE